jgi:hypothetical protein
MIHHAREVSSGQNRDIFEFANYWLEKVGIVAEAFSDRTD